VATGERLVTKHEFARCHRAPAQHDPAAQSRPVRRDLLETKKIAGMAEAFGIQIAPHCYCGPLVAAANIQLAATLPNFLMLESIKTWDGFHAEVLKKKIEWEDGYVIPVGGTRPGCRARRGCLRSQSLERRHAAP
jgi:galactonate dehydratase